MRRIAIIPARGGSKRLPRKNIADFYGKPIIAHTIEAALESKLFESVIVSTEDDEIATISHTYGAEVHRRDASLASDSAKVVDVCLALLAEKEKRSDKYDVMCCLLATSPLRNASHIKEAYQLFEAHGRRFVMAVTQFSKSPWQALRINENGSLSPMWSEWVNIRSQDRPQLLVDNGSTYIVDVDAFRVQKSFYGEGLRGYVMAPEYSVDIDEPADLGLAKYYAARVMNEEGNQN